MDSGAAAVLVDDGAWDRAEEAVRPQATLATIGPAHDASERLGAEWAALAQAASEPNVFAEGWFAGPGLRHLATGEDVRMLEVRRGGMLIGLLPLRPASRYARMPVRHAGNWQHYHSFLGTPLVRRGDERHFWSAALRALDAEPWAGAFLHVSGLVENGPVHRGLIEAASALGRPCDTVLRCERALLVHGLTPQAYYEQAVRKKKRKELNRLHNRLAELGTLVHRTFAAGDDLDAWCDSFLALERAGWKGEEGSALACDPRTERFFRAALRGAEAAGRLNFLRLDLDGRPLAMLVNFLAPPGSFSFKIAFDEEYARFSPGVLIQRDNLAILEDRRIVWMDSCAVEDHSMINSLWTDRRALVRVTVPLAGVRRRALFRLCRTLENLSAAARHRFAGRHPTIEQESND
ncbi:MAG TPA: GNAT family N-acetyltransferase [Allosphingosinicella sp.]|nr:GNAT family N-acetyltransferase [Allosphingosinicella sp.]